MHGSCIVHACLTSTCHAQDLIDCSRYGDPGRFSDPSIGAAVNELARTGAVSAPPGDIPCSSLPVLLPGLAATGVTPQGPVCTLETPLVETLLVCIALPSKTA